jgi:hypothetical protein
MEVLDLTLATWESDDGMAEPTAKQRFERIDSRLEGIERVLELKPPEPRSAFAQFLGHVWQWAVANRSWVIPAAAILVAIGGWFGNPLFKYWLDHRDDDLNHKIDIRIDTALKAPGGVLATLSDVQKTTNETNTSLRTLQPFIHDVISHQFEDVSKLPTRALLERIPAVKNLLAVATDQDVKVDPRIVAKTGEKFIGASANNPAAWEGALATADYRSFLNGPAPSLETFYPLGSPSFPGIEMTHYRFGGVEGKPSPQLAPSLRRVPVALSAHLEFIASPEKQEAQEGPKALLMVGGDLRLDGLSMRSVVLEGVTLHYEGGPVVLENVVFINCQFVIENVVNGRALGSQLLQASNVTFRIPSA